MAFIFNNFVINDTLVKKLFVIIFPPVFSLWMVLLIWKQQIVQEELKNFFFYLFLNIETRL